MKKTLISILITSATFITPSVQAGLKEAYEAFQNSNYSTALTQAQGSSPSGLQDYQLWISGKSALEQKDFSLAQRNLENLTKNHPTSLFWPKAVAALGEVYVEQNENKKAKEFLNKNLDLLSKEAKGEALYYLGKAENVLGDSENAKLHLKQAYVEYPSPALQDFETSFPEILSSLSEAEWSARGMKLFESKNFLEASKAFEKCLSPQCRIRKGRALFALKRNADAIALLSEALNGTDEENAIALLELGQANERNKEKFEANAIYQEIEKKYPNSPQASEACYRRAKEGVEIGDYAALKACISKGYKHDLRDKQLWQAAWVAYEKKQYAEAVSFLKDLQSGAADFPTQAKAAYWMGRSLEKSGQPKKAKEVFAQASEIAPFSYYSFLALKKVQGLNVFHATPKIPATWKQGWIPFEKTAHKNVRLQKIQSLADNGMGRWFRDELNLALDDAKGNPEALKSILSQAKESNLHFLRVFLSQRYWDHFRSLYASQRQAEDVRNALQFPFAFKKEAEREAKAFGLEPEFVVGLMRQESAFMPWVTSSANAQGLMQLLPATARARAKAAGFTLGNLFNPEDNIQVGSAELSYLLNRFSGNWIHAICGYNAGPGRPPQWMARFPGLEDDEYVEEIPFSETNLYVKLVMRNYWSYKTLY